MADLSVQRRRFVDALLGEANGNATRAAILAGYSERTAQEQGSRLRKELAEEISRRLDEQAMGADEVLARLADIARGSIADFIRPTPDGYELDLESAAQAGKLHLVKKLTPTKEGIGIELHSAPDALVQIGKHHRLFAERHEHTGPNGGPIPIREVIIEMPAENDDDAAGDEEPLAG